MLLKLISPIATHVQELHQKSGAHVATRTPLISLHLGDADISTAGLKAQLLVASSYLATLTDEEVQKCSEQLKRVRDNLTERTALLSKRSDVVQVEFLAGTIAVPDAIYAARDFSNSYFASTKASVDYDEFIVNSASAREHIQIAKEFINEQLAADGRQRERFNIAAPIAGRFRTDCYVGSYIARGSVVGTIEVAS